MSDLTPEQQLRGEGFAFFRWHCLRYPEWALCSGRANPRNLCVVYWVGGVR
jgi:hypothetical protein